MEQTPSSDTVSSQKSLPLSHDPGWNDPPQWALSSQSSSAGSTKRFLNKRVAFPLISQSSSPGKSNLLQSSKTPPVLQSSSAPTITSAPHKPLVTLVDKDLPTTVFRSDFDRDQALTEILSNLGTVMTERSMEKGRIEEIQKKLDVMRSDWLENKLNDTIQKSILDISKALLEKDIGEADRIHVALMMQHATVCRVWISAIRHIIFELKKNYENSNVSKPEYLLPLSVEMQEK